MAWIRFVWKGLATTAIVLVASAVSSAVSFGGWTCTELMNGEPMIISQGDFTSLLYMPFISPYVRDRCLETGRRYNSNLNCTFEVTAPEGHFIYIEFIQFHLDTDCSRDFVHLVQLGQPAKSYIASNRFFCDQLESSERYLAVPGNRLELRFLTDHDHACSGFAGFFSAFDPCIEINELAH